MKSSKNVEILLDIWSLIWYNGFIKMVIKIDNKYTFQFVGNLNKSMLGKYREKILDTSVVLTDERLEHVKKRHYNDVIFTSKLKNIINEPDYILDDKDSINTLLILKSIEEENIKIQVVIKLNVDTNEQNRYNSVITFYRVRERNYNSIIKNNQIIYTKIDKFE